MAPANLPQSPQIFTDWRAWLLAERSIGGPAKRDVNNNVVIVMAILSSDADPILPQNSSKPTGRPNSDAKADRSIVL